ncbi:MAG TPA: hemerythrin domain-containing protein [Jiangellaceae bacterium]
MPDDVVDMIMADHREVERLFNLLETQPDQRTRNLPVLSALLIAHSRAEESEVYPVAKDEAGASEKVAHSQEEHVEAEQILERLKAADPTGTEFSRILSELVEAVSHHVEEEESSVLPTIRTALPESRRLELADAFAQSRAEHLGDEPGDATKDELLQMAENVDMSGASTMSKSELDQKLKQQAEQ